MPDIPRPGMKYRVRGAEYATWTDYQHNMRNSETLRRIYTENLKLKIEEQFKFLIAKVEAKGMLDG